MIELHLKYLNNLESQYQLHQFDFIRKEENAGKAHVNYSVLDLTLKYLVDMIYCHTEFKDKLIKLLERHETLYSRYGGKQSINPSIIEKLNK